jgi:hypothetical protein
MASWRRRCSSLHATRTDTARGATRRVLLVSLIAAGCGHAGDATSPPDAKAPAQATASADVLCRPADEGSLQARLQGSIEAELDWGAGVPQCLGGVRPQGDGVRLLYKGTAPDGGALLLILGVAPLRPGESARHVPVNLTVVREGTGQFFATQGDDKCAFDEVRQSPVDGHPGRYRLDGRGYCTQPARALDGTGAVLATRFDVQAIVEDTRPVDDHAPASGGMAR